MLITQPPRVRFAPAPTGYLHLGGARTALFNWLFARHHRGKFILRVEDTDIERSTGESTEQVLAALRWLGLDWDEGPDVGGPYGPYFQTERRGLHLEHARRLQTMGLAYECYMTQEELEIKRQHAIAAGKPFRYEGWHRNLTEEQVVAFRAEGRRPAIRLLVDAPHEGYTVHDLIKGPTHFPPDQIDDFVLVRSDGTPSFHLANVVDDATMRITHVVRGEDHLTNTIRHQILFEFLGYPRPEYAHLPMILGPDRSKLSKRHGAVSVMDYAGLGYLPDAMLNELALLGWSPSDGKEELSRAELIERFDLDRCGKSPSIFDFAKLDHFNRREIKAMPLEELDDRLKPWVSELDTVGIGGESTTIAEAMKSQATRLALIELIRDEMVKLSDFPHASRRVLAEPNWREETLNEDGMQQARAVLEKIESALGDLPEPWERAAIKSGLQATGKSIGAKGKNLFMPVRVAISGEIHGPALDGSLAVLGKQPSLQRIRGYLRQLTAWNK